MEADRIELLDTFGKLDPENRADILAYARIAYTAQEKAKKKILEMIAAGPEYTDRRGAPMGSAENFEGAKYA
jgi:hypothetical protein